MPTEVSVKAASTGALTYFSTYASARSAASSGDVIQIWADLNEQIILKDGVDIFIAPGRRIDMTSALPTIIDNGVKCICNIFGEGILKNSYTGGTKYECVRLSDDESEVYIECDYLVGLGGTTADARFAATINVIAAAKFSVVCNNIYSHRNSAVIITGCDDFYIKCKTITSGTFDGGTKNEGAAVVYVTGSGYIIADEIRCDGYGSCLSQAGGIVNGNILKFTTLTNGTAAHPTILLDNVVGEQNLILSFDEIQNLNSSDGDAVTLAEGKADLTGRRIYSYKGLSLDLGASANIKCTEIISDTQGINISNTDPEKVIIDADIIEGNIGNYGVVYAINSANFTIRNAKVKNVSSSSSSVGIYLDPGNGNPYIEVRNIIVVTGDPVSGETIYENTGSNVTYIYNYGTYANKNISGPSVIIGTDLNYKVIIDTQVS